MISQTDGPLPRRIGIQHIFPLKGTTCVTQLEYRNLTAELNHHQSTSRIIIKNVPLRELDIS